MDSDKLNRWISLGANLGVLFGIIILAVEIRQNTQTTRAQMIQSRAATAMSLAAETFNSDWMPDIWAKNVRGEELSAQEAFRYNTWFRATLRNQDNNIQQYNQGLLGDHIPRATRRVISAVIINSPRGRDFWERSKSSYSDELQEFVDTVIAEHASAQ